VLEDRRRHERIVGSGNDERGNADSIDHAHRGGTAIVIGRVREAEVWRRVELVEHAHGVDAVEMTE